MKRLTPLQVYHFFREMSTRFVSVCTSPASVTIMALSLCHFNLLPRVGIKMIPSQERLIKGIKSMYHTK